MAGTTTQEVKLLATEEEGPVLDLRTVHGMVLDETKLTRTPRNTIIFVYMGNFVDPSTLSELHFGLFHRFDAPSLTVHYQVVREAAPLNPEQAGVRAEVTNKLSGLYLPASVREEQSVQAARLQFGEHKAVRLDEDYIILDGATYAAYMEEAARRQAGNDGYSR